MNDFNCEKQWGTTKIKTLQINYEWVVYDFIVGGKKTGEFIESPTFSSPKYDAFKWSLKLYPRGINEENKDFLSIYLDLKSENPFIEVYMECSLLNKDGKRVYQKETTHLYMKEESHGFDNFISKNDLENENNGLFLGRKLIITFNVTAGVGCENYKCDNEQEVEEFKYQAKLCHELKSFFSRKELTDVTLVSKNSVEFEAHKVFLAARSEVFLAMFKNEMLEKDESKIKIPDIDGDVLEHLLHFIYCGEVKNLEEYAYELLTASDKYQINDLKILCEQYLGRKISIENAIKILILADRHSCEKLKNQVIHFIIAHRADIMKTPEFKQLTNSHSSMIIDLLLTMVFNSP